MQRRPVVIAVVLGFWAAAFGIELQDGLPARDVLAGCCAAAAFTVVFRSQSLGLRTFLEQRRQTILDSQAAPQVHSAGHELAAASLVCDVSAATTRRTTRKPSNVVACAA